MFLFSCVSKCHPSSLPCFCFRVSFVKSLLQQQCIPPGYCLALERRRVGKASPSGGQYCFHTILLACPGQLAGDSMQQMSQEDKVRHILHQTLITDGFCQAELLLFPPLVFDFLLPHLPSVYSSPLQMLTGEQDGFLICTGFYFSWSFVFYSILFYCERTIAISTETWK